VNTLEILNKMNYESYCDFLIKKYGQPDRPYFTNSNCKSKPKENSRTKEGLCIHHIWEDQIIRLSDPRIAKMMPFELQMPKNLLYCDYVEHLILHIKITEESDGTELFKVGVGGVKLLIPTINDFLCKEYTCWRQWPSKVVKSKEEDYMVILKYLLRHPFRYTKFKDISNTTFLSSSYSGETYNKILEQIRPNREFLNKVQWD